MKALVLGGNGFIGSHVVDRLLTEGHTVRVFDRSPDRYRAANPRVRYYQASFGDIPTLAEAVEGVDVVFHLISTTVPSTSNRDPVADVASNLENTLRLLELVRGSSVGKIVYMSSGGTVYGVPVTIPIPENHPLHPLCSYGVVKVAVENYLYMYGKLYGLKYVALRASNPYGPRQGHSGVQGIVGTAFDRVIHNHAIEIWGDGHVIRDYIYVSDLADLIVKSGASDIDGVFNAGSGVGTSINEVIEAIFTTCGHRIEVIRKPGRAFDIPKVVLDMTKTKAAFDWSPSTSLTDGLLKSWEWLKTQHGREA